jgi:hypothetical protein
MPPSTPHTMRVVPSANTMLDLPARPAATSSGTLGRSRSGTGRSRSRSSRLFRIVGPAQACRRDVRMPRIVGSAAACLPCWQSFWRALACRQLYDCIVLYCCQRNDCVSIVLVPATICSTGLLSRNRDCVDRTNGHANSMQLITRLLPIELAFMCLGWRMRGS